MRPALIALSALAVASAFAAPMNHAQARDYPWCAQYSERAGGGRNCGFVSFAQCRATATGSAAWCEPNPRYAQTRDDRRRHHEPYGRD